jgi:hypothetical protein
MLHPSLLAFHRTAFRPAAAFTSLLALTLSFLLALHATPAYAQDQGTMDGDVKTYEATVPLDAEGRVRIDTYKGSVTVTTWDRAEVQYAVRVEPDDDPELVPDTEIRIDRTDRSISFETDYEEAQDEHCSPSFRGCSMPFAHYTLTVPRGATFELDDYKSAIDVRGLVADVEIETYKGELTLADFGGDLELETYKGTGTVDGVRGDLELDTYKGEIEVQNLQGALDLDTYKGDVEVAFAAFDGDSRVETYKGRVRFVLPDGAGFDLRTDFGDRADLDADFDLASLRTGEHDYRGAVNGGGPRLSLDSYKGDIRVTFR